MNTEELNILIVHRDRLERATTFEEFKKAQLKLLTWMIERRLVHVEAEKSHKLAIDKFLDDEAYL